MAGRLTIGVFASRHRKCAMNRDQWLRMGGWELTIGVVG